VKTFGVKELERVSMDAYQECFFATNNEDPPGSAHTQKGHHRRQSKNKIVSPAAVSEACMEKLTSALATFSRDNTTPTGTGGGGDSNIVWKAAIFKGFYCVKI
jgi:hypothetical protein